MGVRVVELKVGVVGPGGDEFNRDRVWQRLMDAFGDVARDNLDKHIVVVGFGIDRGLPGLAYHLAKEYGWKTLSIKFPDSLQHPRFLVDRTVTIDPRPENIRQCYFDQCDAIVRIGGSDELRTVVSQLSQRVYEYDL